MRRRALFGGLLAVLPLGIPARTKDHVGTNQWARRNLAVLDYTGPELDGYVEIITANWDAALGGGIRLNYQRREMRVDCAGVEKQDGAIVVCNYRDSPGAPVGIGYTKVWGSNKPGRRDDLIAAKVQLVARAWGTNSPESGYWWHPLGCHEMGHALGLPHDQDNARSCMGTQRQTPGWMDVRKLRKKYGGCHAAITGATPVCCAELPLAERSAATKRCNKTKRRRRHTRH